MTKKKILLFILILVVAVVALVYFLDRQNLKRLEAARANLETAKAAQESDGVELIKADLNLYYVVHKSYPWEISDVEEAVEEAQKGNYKVTQDAISGLKDFSYEIKGNRQAYKFSYTDLNEKRVTEEGNYQADFHKSN